MNTTSLQLKINSLPTNLRQEVADFVEFLKTKKVVKSKFKKREFGCGKSKIILAKDFDSPLEIFKDYV